jgi:hypothetical protein
MTRLLGSFVFSVLLCALCWAQSFTGVQPPSAKEDPSKPVASEVMQSHAPGARVSDGKEAGSPVIHLTAAESVISKTETAWGFTELSCDSDGNVFLGPAGNGDAIRKINAKAELVASFTPEANPDVKVYGVGRYSVSRDGELYVPVGSQETHGWHLLVFKSDGSYSTNIKLDAGFGVQPATVTVFANGNLLITGMKLDRSSKLFIVPFTGIFRSDGRLLKEITLEQDEHLPDTSAMSNLQPGQAVPVITNRAVGWGQTEAAKDGNIYVMRWSSPVAFYAISAGGEVVKRFKVDPGAAYYVPDGMHIAGNRIAVMFRHGTDDRILRIVDLDGRELASYTISSDEIPASQRLGIFACYSQNPERFTFLSSDDGFKLKITLAEPQ